MIGFLSKLFGGSKSDKDVKRVQPIVAEINRIYNELQSLSHDELRNKTYEFRAQIREYLKDIDAQIAEQKAAAEQYSETDLHAREAVYNEVDKLIKNATSK